MTEQAATGSAIDSGKRGASRRLLAWILHTALVLLVMVAVLLSAGRLLVPLIAGQQAVIERELGDMLGTRVAISGLEGDWHRFTPVINIGELQIINPENPGASHVIGNLSIRPALWTSLFTGDLVIDQVMVAQSRFELRQNGNGTWSLAGLAGGAVDYTDTIVDFLLTTRRMRIVEVGLVLHWQDGRRLDLANIYFDLSNAGNRHVLELQARIAGQASPFQLQVALTGDPREEFTGEAWLHASQLDLAEHVRVPDVEITTLRFSGDLWARLAGAGLYDLQADITELALAGQGTREDGVQLLDLQNGGFRLALRHDIAGRWQAWLDGAEFDWQNRPWSAAGLYVDYREAGDDRPLEIRADSLDLAMAHDVVDDLFRLPERAASALADLNPEGRLQNLVLSTDLAGYEDGFLLRANVADGAVGAWQGAPAGSGIAGYVEAGATRGFAELDSSAFTIHLPRLFTDSWSYDRANARVHWQVGDGFLRVNSGVIDVSNDFIHGHVQFDLYNHLDSRGERESELTLLIGLMDMDASYKSLYLPTLEKLRGTMDWLDAALQGGNITNSGFAARFSTLRDAPVESGTVLSFYNVSNGRLKFLPDWPELTAIDAFVSVDNNTADVLARTGTIERIALAETTATLRPRAEGGSLLSLAGSADAGTAAGLAFLRNTPVRNNFGDFLDDWRGEGSIHVDLALGIPINAPGAADVNVNVVSNLSTLTIPDYSLSVNDIRGRVIYDSELGLSANALSGRLFDFPFAATIEPLVRETEGVRTITGTRIVGSGRASKTGLQEWPGQPGFVRDVLNFASGEIDYLAEITIPYADVQQGGGTRVRVTSELLGLALDLPPPFGKTVDNIRPLELLINFSDADEWLSVRFDNRVGANLQVADGEFAGGRVVLGPQSQQMTFGPVALEAPGLVFSGDLESFDYNAWETTAGRFNDFAGNAEPAGLEDFITRADVRVGNLQVIGQELLDVQVGLDRTGGIGAADAEPVAPAWRVELANTLLSGSFEFPDDAALPWQIDLDYLRLPEAEEEAGADGEAAEEVDILADVDPAALPPMDFRSLEFTVGDKQLGAWEFKLRTSGDSASISELRMTTPDASIRDESGAAGANMNWRYSGGMHTTSFTGLFSAGDLARVLPGWGFSANVESERATFVSALQWAGSPATFSLDKVIGDVQLEIRDGRFVDIDSGGSRLFGAFSFDSLVRRLQLDFSDLYERGLAYDRIAGHLDFDQGIVRTEGPFEINGPSSRITLNGEINLVNETIDADMLVNVPLGQNLSVLAGILGAWPIAVSTYIASRIFKNQVDDFTTVVYRLEGPWENPTSGFEPSEEILEAVTEPETAAGDAAADDNPGSP